MEQVSVTPLTFGMEETRRKKPLAYAKYIVRDTKTFFGKYTYVVLFNPFLLTFRCKMPFTWSFSHRLYTQHLTSLSSRVSLCLCFETRLQIS